MKCNLTKEQAKEFKEKMQRKEVFKYRLTEFVATMVFIAIIVGEYKYIEYTAKEDVLFAILQGIIIMIINYMMVRAIDIYSTKEEIEEIKKKWR